MSHFFAYLSKMKFVKRWGLMRSTHVENLQEHSQQVAMIAHALAVIRNTVFGGTVDAERAAVLGLYHDASEVITGDLISPIKHFNQEISQAYGALETIARQRLHDMLPERLRPAFAPLLFAGDHAEPEWELVHAADKLCAYLKCVEELRTGNDDFAPAAQSLSRDVQALGVPEVDYFLETFAPSFSRTLDELN